MKVSNKIPNAAANQQSATDKTKSTKAGGAESLLDTKSAKSAKDVSGSSPSVLSSDELMDSARVDLSPRSQQIRKAKELATPSESVDEAKVARLQAMIDGGRYKIDAEAIADRLLDEHMKMPI